MSIYRNKDLVSYFYEKTVEGIYKCRLCATERTQQDGRGYSNLISHLCGKHPDYREEYSNAFEKKALTAYFNVNTKAKTYYSWIHWVVERNLPLSEVDSQTTRDQSRFEPICSKTMLKYMDLICRKIEDKISTDL
jgi:hypothetical protein